MKDIKDYFSSPQKKVEATSENVVPQVSEIEPDSVKTKEKYARKRKKKKKRKHSDPAVRDVTQLLSDSLKFSPNNSGQTNRSLLNENFTKVSFPETPTNSDSPPIMKENKPINRGNGIIKEGKLKNGQIRNVSVEFNVVEKVLETDENINKDADRKAVSDNLNSVNTDNKVNAFQLLMDRRNRSIGMNSPGKDFDQGSSPEHKVDKEKLAARRDLFLNWSEQKGGLKRKRLEEEKDEIIEKKLRIRAKRLKKLLKAEHDKMLKEKRVSKKKKIVKIESSSEDSDTEVKEMITKDKCDSVKHQSVVSKKKKHDKLKDGVTDTKTIVKPNQKSEKCERKPKLDDNIHLPSDDKGLLNANGKRTYRKKKQQKNNSKLLDNSIDDFEENIQNRTVKENNKNDKNNKIPKSSKVEMNNGSKKSTENKAGSMLAFITSDKCKETDLDTKFDVIEDNESGCENIVEEKTSKGSKRKRKRSKTVTKSDSNKDLHITRKESTNICLSVDESSQESVITPRALRSRHLKVKTNKYADGTPTRKAATINYAEDSSNDAIDLSSESENEKRAKSPKKPIKLAPVFSKAAPKPKEDPAVVEARKQFLMSGIPASLKKTIERQNSAIEQHNSFPITQHVQQRCDSSFWTLPCTELKFVDTPPLQVDPHLKYEHLTKKSVIKSINIEKEVKKVDKLKVLLHRIKAENPNYPVYKSFRQIHEKSGYKFSETEDTTKTPETKRKRGRKKKEKDVVKPVEVIQKTELDSVEYTMWTEKYKPKCSNDIIGNTQAIKSLKKWLEDWKQFSQEINAKKRRRSTSSESEFEKTDCDSRESSILPGKIIVLGGPCGSGKTTAVYALCNELGFNVIELNASSKRTGKRLFQEIQEATQSHQVRNKESQPFQTFFKSNSQTGIPENAEKASAKMCAILVEDIDIVFEQDDGFINGLLQLSTTSKRPIIATTTDYSSIFVQKFLENYEYIEFFPLSSFLLSTWLQLVILVEGMYVSQDEIGSLLEYNKGDVRRTLLQFQFWVQSGGQLQQNRSLIKLDYKRMICDEQIDEDEIYDCVGGQSSIEGETFEHKNCIESFEIIEAEEPFWVPYYLNLGLLWWNLPNILNLPNFFSERVHCKQSANREQQEKSNTCKKRITADTKSISLVYDSLSCVDVTFRKNNFAATEPLVRHSVDVKDSLELSEVLDRCRDLEFVHELTHFLVNGSIANCSTVNDEGYGLNLTMPDKAEKRWRTKIYKCEDAFSAAIPVSTERRAAAMDYMPALRNITRSEFLRSRNNTKRGNRFRYYLRDIGIKCNENLIENACKMLNSIE